MRSGCTLACVLVAWAMSSHWSEQTVLLITWDTQLSVLKTDLWIILSSNALGWSTSSTLCRGVVPQNINLPKKNQSYNYVLQLHLFVAVHHIWRCYAFRVWHTNVHRCWPLSWCANFNLHGSWCKLNRWITSTRCGSNQFWAHVQCQLSNQNDPVAHTLISG
jgi:hypothetical protein